jgi:16S rRNA (adenine1518-N6/adenine1519-N6)-dimethyltransferase
MDLWNQNHLLDFLKKHGLYAKKQLGQNFLVDKEVLDKILETANIQSSDIIIEVGPGIGVLTKELVKSAKEVLSIELDKTLIPILEESLKEYKNLKIIEEDALKFTPEINKYKIVANIPYNISSPLLNHFLQAENKPESLTLLVQKEVAEKICETEKQSILSLQVQFFGEAKYIKTVKPESFYPSPKVDSAIIHIETFQKDDQRFIPTEEVKKILRLAKVGFSQKRKILLTTLRKNFKFDQEKLNKIFKTLEIPLQARPQTLSIQDWRKLTKTLE